MKKMLMIAVYSVLSLSIVSMLTAQDQESRRGPASERIEQFKKYVLWNR